MTQPLAFVLALVLALAVLLPRSQKAETYAVAELTQVHADPAALQSLNRSLVFVVVSGYLEAAEQIKKATQTKPMCDPLLKGARDNVARSLADKLAPFKPATKQALQDAAARLMERLDSFVKQAHCNREGRSGTSGRPGLYFVHTSIKDVAALHRDLKQLSVTFNSGVRA